MRNINLVAFVVAILISSLFAQAQTTTVDSTTTVGKNKKTEVVSAKTTVKTTKAEIKGLQKLIKEKKDLIELTQKQMPNVGDKTQRKALGDSVKVWNKQISTWNKEIKALEKRKKGEGVDIAKAKKGFDRVMVQADTTKTSPVSEATGRSLTDSTYVGNVIDLTETPNATALDGSHIATLLGTAKPFAQVKGDIDASTMSPGVYQVSKGGNTQYLVHYASKKGGMHWALAQQDPSVAIAALSPASTSTTVANRIAAPTKTTITAANTASNDSTPIRPQAETDFIKRNYGKHAYGTAIDIVVLSDDKVDVQTFQNVKSRSGKSETQWGVTVKHADGSVTEYLVSGENPADALNDKLSLANTEGNGGTAKLSVKHGDDTDGKLSPSDLE